MGNDTNLNSASMDQRVAQLSPEKRRILEQFLLRKEQEAANSAGGKVESFRIPRRTSNDNVPLSFAQQRIWFLDQFAPGSSFYNVDNALRIRFPLDTKALERSYNETVRRHESLRTTFQSVNGKPIQVIAPSLYLPMEVRDLQSLPVAERESAALQIATEEAIRRFDLAQGPLVRTVLVRLGKADNLLILSMHHIISDGWSMNIFAGEITKLYAAFCLGKPSPLPPLPIQYADFAIWQRQLLQGSTLESHLAYWKQQLADLAVLELPTDHPRPAVMSYRGARMPIAIPGRLYEDLKLLSQRESVTPFMTMLAAFQTLLHRYTSQVDIVVGVPTANRNRVELEPLIGFFVNTLVIREHVSGELRFSELLARVRSTALDAFAHEDLPFEKLVEELHAERDLSRHPLFQVCFQLFNLNEISAAMYQPVSVANGIAKFDLRLDLLAGARQLTGFIEYSTDLFESSTIERMFRHFLTLLQAIVADPQSRISDLPLVNAEELRKSLVTWNATKSEYPLKCVHEVFERQVEHTPDSIAVHFDNEQLTYRELNRKANQLGHYLRSRGVGPDLTVGVFLRRSVNMVMAKLAILKAGGAYVPLDPEYPRERLEFILRDSGASLLLTSGSGGIVSDSGVPVVDIDAEGVAHGPWENLSCTTFPDNLAYVMYTSGSTGQPKGIGVAHRAVVRLVCNTNYLSLGSADCIAQASNVSFDAATFEIWGALLTGARLVGIPKDVLLAPDQLSAALTLERITTLFLTTELFNQIVSESPKIFSGLATLLFGGSLVNPAAVKSVLANGPPGRLLHVYGPTEATTFASFHELQELSNGATKVPIGRPLANTQLYVLDEYGNPSPPGVPGELHIGGDGLARGYLNAPAATAAKFVPNPFVPDRSARLYRTGDQAKYDSDGAIEFLGRRDRQVKVRGFRIEVGEVESTLRSHPLVVDAAVVARENLHGDKRLTAYVVPGDTKSPANGHSTDMVAQWQTLHDEVVSDETQQFLPLIRAFLHERLPDYMVPSAFVMLDALPLTPNGKVDFQSLAPPEPTRPDLERGYAGPSSPLELTLTRIWQQVLGLDRVGVHDNFFELGGDSILSIQIVARARQAGLELTPKQFFQSQTIAELAAVVAPVPSAQADQRELDGQTPLTPVQRWFFEQDLSEPHHFNQAVLLETPAALDAGVLRRVFQQLIEHHDAFRLRFTRAGAEWLQSFSSPDEQLPFASHDLSTLPDTEQSKVIEEIAAAAQGSLDLLAGPLVRMVLFTLGPTTPSRLLIIIHHLIVDGVSWRILSEDLWTAYAQVCRGEAIHFPPKTASLRQWAEHLLFHAKAPAIRNELEYWSSVFEGPIAQLPRDFNAAENLVESAETISVSLTPADTDALLREVPKAYQTQINDVLLTALLQSCSRWTGESELLLDLEGHGREPFSEGIDVSRTVGWFTSIFPVRLRLEPEASEGDALKSIKEQLRRIPNRGIGYGLLRYLSGDVGIQRTLSEQKQPEISFNYLGQMSSSAAATAQISLARESSGPTHSPRQRRRHLLEINASVVSGCLHIQWTFNHKVHRQATIYALAQDVAHSLRSLMLHCQSSNTGGYTPSDFSKARLSQLSLDKLVAKVKKSRGEE